MSTSSTSTAPKPSFSLKNVLLAGVPLVIVVVAVFAWQYNAAQREVPPPVDFLGSVKVALHSPTQLVAGLTDADGDLVADAPTDEARFLNPETLVFEVLGADLEREDSIWADFVKHLEKATGREVRLDVRPAATSLAPSEAISPALQLARDMLAGEVHLAALNTGAVTLCVREGGAVPFCVMADADGKFGYEMEIIVPAKSPIDKVPQLKGSQRVVFASLNSHSGFRVPLTTLWKEFDLQPERDYTPVFVSGQEQAIKEVASGKGNAAPVASDFLLRVIAQGTIPKDAVRSIYKSKVYPPACFAYAHQLKPELADKIKTAFLEFPWEGTSLEKAYAPANQSRFVPVSYQQDWASVREVEDVVAALLKARQTNPSSTND